MCDKTYMFSSPKLQTCSAKYGVILSVFVPMDQVRQNMSVTESEVAVSCFYS